MKPVDNHVARRGEYEEVNCYFCEGFGFKLDWTDDGGLSQVPTRVPCEHCNGTGKYKVEV